MSKISLIDWMVVLLAGVMTVSCSQDNIMPEPERPVRPELEEDRLKDSVYVYTYGFYLWQEELPDWRSNIRERTAHFRSAEELLTALKGYARDESGELYDRYSFLDRWGTVNAEVQQGLAGSFGIDVRYLNDDELYIKRVDIGSPAYSAGIRRGWRVMRVNGRTDLSLASMERDNFTFLFNALDAGTITLGLVRPDGSEVSVELARKSYQLQPILARQVYAVGGKRIGYFAFDVFISTLNERNNPTYVKGQLDRLMEEFEGEGVQELIVDLRYNGGGAVITAEYLSNLLAPATANGQLMYTSKANEGLVRFLHSRGSDIDLSPVYFNKVNGLNINRIYFLVTESTASASELLINNLEPYMDVKLIGEHATYGKPVGYFPWDIRGVDLYAVSFQMFNAKGYGDYFSGMGVDKEVYDDLTRDFGDPAESMIAEALYYAAHGRFSADGVNRRAGIRAADGNTVSSHLNRALDRQERKGMYVFDVHNFFRN
ncbi:Peptidase family S41 [Parapedobacter composti]|uniref:Peptidase family S41 n=1 Tax=Parapedobacter composti TaxID=623281 RepID=A0A1I1H9E0_9SPHI|nr:S41 family peptidase [Parapedobacter composti]SFC20376.1 Peptidase family S41 [Parapedobacter composti]